MFKYVGDISNISHYIITEFLKNKNVAIDGTLGNGHDTDFLKDNFKKVYSFEIQEEPCKSYINKNIENVIGDIPVDVSISMPVKIVETNSDQVVNDDKTIKYSYTINDLNENNSIMIGFKVPNIQNIVIALVIIILIIVIIIIYYIKKRKK